MYRVFQDGKPCSEYQIKGWDTDTFLTHREAELFAYMWSYPVDKDTAKVNYIPMELGQEYDMSMGTEPVMMKIEKVDLNLHEVSSELLKRLIELCHDDILSNAEYENDGDVIELLKRIDKHIHSLPKHTLNKY